jgi:hypothetical protein
MTENTQSPSQITVFRDLKAWPDEMSVQNVFFLEGSQEAAYDAHHSSVIESVAEGFQQAICMLASRNLGRSRCSFHDEKTSVCHLKFAARAFTGRYCVICEKWS